eukprot:IDg6006t1
MVRLFCSSAAHFRQSSAVLLLLSYRKTRASWSPPQRSSKKQRKGGLIVTDVTMDAIVLIDGDMEVIVMVTVMVAIGAIATMTASSLLERTRAATRAKERPLQASYRNTGYFSAIKIVLNSEQPSRLFHLDRSFSVV